MELFEEIHGNVLTSVRVMYQIISTHLSEPFRILWTHAQFLFNQIKLISHH